MAAVQVFTIVFHASLYPQHVKHFRRAVCSAVSNARPRFKKGGIQTDLFHNHNEETGANINRYPLIQYHTSNRAAAITGIGKGAAALAFFAGLLESMERPMVECDNIHFNLAIDKTITQECTLKKSTPPVEYFLRSWLPMDDKAFAEWEQYTNYKKRIDLLNQCLQRQLTKFMAACGATTTCRAYVSDVLHSGWKNEFKFRKKCMDVNFFCNVLLPEEIGIGQVPSIGFGRIKHFKQNVQQ